MPKTSRIQISICTYQRPRMLKRCLSSIALINIPDNTEVFTAVIDNDPQQKAETITQTLASQFPFPLQCHLQTQRGIPFARNKALEVAKKNNADYIVFIDDDEWVEKDWLKNLFAYARTHREPAIIYGKVIYDLPPQTPRHLSLFYTPKQKATGEKLGTCATNNVLIPLNLVWQLDLKFDEKFSLTGGEDTQFFQDALAAGASIYSCQEAIVHETVPPSRATLRWLSQRKFRVGIGMVPQKKRKRSSAVLVPLTMFNIFTRLTTSAMCLLLGNKQKSAAYWLKACRSSGVICGLFGFNYEEYQTIHGE